MLRIVLGSGRRKQQANSSTSNSSTTSGADVASNGASSSLDSTSESSSEEQIETWTEWLQRATHQVEEQLSKIGIDSWVTKCRKIKFQRVGQTLQMKDSRWSKRALLWDPGSGIRPYRQVGRPKR
eukprot:10421148-Karenia_brevis.AAC.1